MPPYALELAQARVEAMQALRADLKATADNPAERRRISTVIFNAPEPSEIDDLLEYANKGAPKDVIPVPQADPRAGDQPLPNAQDAIDDEPADPNPAPLDPDEDPLPQSVDPEVLLAISPAIDVQRFQHNPGAMHRPLRNLLRAQLQLRAHSQPQPRAP